MIHTIHQPNDFFAKIVGFLPNSGDRKCKYVLSLDTQEGLLLYNTLSLEMVFIEGKTKADWHADNFSPDDRNTLRKKYFYVPENFDEAKTTNQLRSIAHTMDEDKTVYTVFTTTACNARCAYCFENGITARRMNDKTAIATADYILRTNTGDEILVKWFGGEPLLNTRAIDIISQKFSDAGAKFKSSLTTNGFLIDDEIIDKAKNLWRLSSAQITLDGTSEVYARIKKYVNNPQQPLEKVLKNIEKLIAADIKVCIRLNLSLENQSDLELLIDQLCQRFKGKENLTIAVSPLYEYFFKENDDKADEVFEANQKLQGKINKLHKEAKYTMPTYWRHRTCMADCKVPHVINADGSLAQCEHINIEQHAGDIFNGIDNSEELKQWKEPNKTEKCLSCVYNPVCYISKKCEGKGFGHCSPLIYRWYENYYRRTMAAVYKKWQEER